MIQGDSFFADGQAEPAASSSQPVSLPEIKELMCFHHLAPVRSSLPQRGPVLQLGLLNAFVEDVRADAMTQRTCERVPAAMRSLKQSGFPVKLCCWLRPMVLHTVVACALQGKVYGHEALIVPKP